MEEARLAALTVDTMAGFLPQAQMVASMEARMEALMEMARTEDEKAARMAEYQVVWMADRTGGRQAAMMVVLEVTGLMVAAPAELKAPLACEGGLMVA